MIKYLLYAVRPLNAHHWLYFCVHNNVRVSRYWYRVCVDMYVCEGMF